MHMPSNNEDRVANIWRQFEQYAANATLDLLEFCFIFGLVADVFHEYLGSLPTGLSATSVHGKQRPWTALTVCCPSSTNISSKYYKHGPSLQERYTAYQGHLSV